MAAITDGFGPTIVPVAEPRRAAALREFNGLAAEVKRMNVVITALDPNPSTAEAEPAVTQGQTLVIGSGRRDGDVGGISRQAGDVLRQIG